jgi:hypothetical protein
VFVRKQMDGGVLKRMIAPRFENEGKVKDHGMIISTRSRRRPRRRGRRLEP